MVSSNHFPIELDKNIQYSEWHMRFFKKEDKEKYL